MEICVWSLAPFLKHNSGSIYNLSWGSAYQSPLVSWSSLPLYGQMHFLTHQLLRDSQLILFLGRNFLCNGTCVHISRQFTRVAWKHVICFLLSQGVTIKRLLWVSEESLNFGLKNSGWDCERPWWISKSDYSSGQYCLLHSYPILVMTWSLLLEDIN